MNYSLIKSFCLVNKVGHTCRLYSKNVLFRKPVRVFNLPEDPMESIKKETLSSKLQLSNQRDESLIEGTNTKKAVIPYYEKLTKTDARFTQTLGIIKSRLLRESNGEILLEGKRLINDAIDAGIECKTLFFSREEDLADINYRRAPKKPEFFKVLYKTMKIWSDLKTCPGVMGVFTRPSIDDIHLLSEPVLPVNILCDNIRDPGNLGSIIRCAAAAGCQNILLMKDCVDPWEAKVLKTGCGGHFRIPIIKDIEWTRLSNYLSEHSKIFIVDNRSDIEPWEQTPEFINYDESPKEIEEDKSESEEPDSDSEEIEPAQKYVKVDENSQIVEIDSTFDEPDELEMFEDIKLPCHLYSSAKFPKENIVLYVGGETHDVDNRIVKFACKYGGTKLKIPLENNMDSINSSFAMTIILYEIKRQFVEKYVM